MHKKKREHRVGAALQRKQLFTKDQRKKRLHVMLFAILCSALLLTDTVSAAGLSDGGTLISESQKKSSKKVSWPSGPKESTLSCESAVVMELSTGLVLYELNSHKKQYPASITKILTAMLTAENCSMSETVTFSESAVYGIESGSSTIYTDVGEKMTVEQCLYAIMLESANEVCLGVAEHISGSTKKFVQKMNERVAELGLTDTHFNNPNGLPDTKHYTSAYDMAVISREAFKNSTFRKITGTKSYLMEPTNTHKMERTWNNHHQMINGYQHPEYEYKYCIGGKTGYTQAAGNTLVTYAEKDGMQLVCVVMKSSNPDYGEPNEYTDTTSLLNFGFENYEKYTLDGEESTVTGELFNTYGSYFNTEESPVHLDTESSVVLPKGVELSSAKQKIKYNEDVTLAEGDNVIGTVTYTYGGKTVGSTDIIYTKKDSDSRIELDSASRQIVDQEIESIKATEESDAQKANLWRKIKNGITGFFQFRIVRIILLLLAAVFVIFLLTLLIRRVHLPHISLKRRPSGGYRSKRGRRNYQRNLRNASRERKAGRKKTRRRNRNYEQKTADGQKKNKRGVRYHKRHKNTKESFGKNFFDF
ncbi:MAG: D-alanyl-D-alanine carboxypeptidase [Clostridiaceae bacterium]|nr:D-alanyl-D-alanine carboxypeptidase [Clostridiaceae bacterium]